MSDIIERLLNRVAFSDREEAADTIAALTAERDQLRDYLRSAQTRASGYADERDRLREELDRRKIADEMDAVAIRHAHKLALDLECVLSDYHGRWWDAAINTIGEYREAMNAIHERESPTFMGEPVIAAKGKP